MLRIVMLAVILPTVLDHWGVGLHWGYCLGNFSWVQWVLRLSLYTASIPWGQGAAWLMAWVTSIRRHRGRRAPAMADISSVTGPQRSLIDTLLYLWSCYSMVLSSLDTTTPGIPPLTAIWARPRCPQFGLSVAAHFTLGSELGSLSPTHGVMAWKAWSLLTCAHYYYHRSQYIVGTMLSLDQLNFSCASYPE